MAVTTYKTIKRYNTPHHSHYLTFSCFKRRPFLIKDRSRQWFVDALSKSLQKHDYILWAWVIMPEHVHLLVHPRQNEYDISLFLKSLKLAVTNQALQHVRKHAPSFLAQMLDVQPNGTRSHRFWQRGPGYDTNLWTPKHIWEKIDYIHRNPVRRKLARLPKEWPWSSALDFAHQRDAPLLPLGLDSIPWVPQ